MPSLDRVHPRRSPRLAGFNYAEPRAYFVTFCTADRVPLLARVVDGRVRLSPYGSCVVVAWRWVLAHYPAVQLVDTVIMPDHIHAVVVLRPGAPGRVTASDVVRAVKTRSTRLINFLRGSAGEAVWQRSFHDRILRTPKELARACRYIRDNPHCWSRTHATNAKSRDP